MEIITIDNSKLGKYDYPKYPDGTQLVWDNLGIRVLPPDPVSHPEYRPQRTIYASPTPEMVEDEIGYEL